ncbi:DNA repair protein RadC [Burkholderia contaminans]|uniref:RadC family protein n=1 Tax=Burkholderia contaminans TaxID=488447 RepID=UPI001CF13F20|nr:DNA repair protein RadC [Burkholderia contaminans]MCA7914739.1 DNA repair protein RadC [Burkholderia contaminans]MCA8097058.1 DNA repair protein RadC [Burkholderia contaminans]UUX36553.1 DNA repair protein RadC [Burkholderia contaminans]
MLSPCLALPLPPVECRDTDDLPATPSGRALPIRRRKRRRGDWRPERPRERLLERGPAALTDDELIALLLGTGKPGHDVFVTARALIAQFKTLRGLLEANTDDFEAHPGIGPARSARLVAVIEIARRVLKEKARVKRQIDSPGAVEDFLRLEIGARPHEVFVAVYLDARHGLIETEEITRGSLTRMAVYPREIVRRAMVHNAAALIVAHNHPSGAVQPSAEDRRLTRVLHDALALVDVRLLDHVVIGTSDTFSFARAGWL